MCALCVSRLCFIAVFFVHVCVAFCLFPKPAPEEPPFTMKVALFVGSNASSVVSPIDKISSMIGWSS